MIGILHGRCVCGALTYTLAEGQRSPPYACHCTDCQTRTGSAFSEHMIISEADVSIAGSIEEHVQLRENGSKTTHIGCATCGTIILSKSDARLGSATLRCGTLEVRSLVEPRAHFWTRSKQPWFKLSDQSKQHLTQPIDPIEWLRSLRG